MKIVWKNRVRVEIMQAQPLSIFFIDISILSPRENSGLEENPSFPRSSRQPYFTNPKFRKRPSFFHVFFLQYI